MLDAGCKLFGVTWDYRSTGRPRRDQLGRTLSVALGSLAAVAVPLQASAASAPAAHRLSGPTSAVIVRAAADREPAAEVAVRAAGGQVGRRFGLINGFAATLPAAALPSLRADADLAAITPNASGHLLLDLATPYNPAADPSSMASVTQKYGAQRFWGAGYTGKGVDVALIDSGVAPVDGLTTPGKVVNGPDLSFEGQKSSLTYLDTFGHGTHMAGIIAGRDNAATGPYAGDTTHFLGVAPDARILSLKVADAHGQTDISQMLAAIGWVVEHRQDHGLNIRVLNLSYGTDSQQPFSVDPLAFAAEAAWKSGILVVAAAGNQGAAANQFGLTDPAYDPMVLAVGASQSNGSAIATDRVAPFSSVATGDRRPDLVAPGSHLQSLRVPGSYIDQTFAASGRISDRFFRGSGTSQAAAATSGAAALVFSQYPNATPDQVKSLLMGTALSLDETRSSAQGRGSLNLNAALTAPLPAPPRIGSVSRDQGEYSGDRSENSSTGTASIEGARGTNHVVMNGSTLSGEQDANGHELNPLAVATAVATTGSSWSGSSWSGGSWSGSSWSGSSWSGSSWSGSSWSAAIWAGSSWS